MQRGVLRAYHDSVPKKTFFGPPLQKCAKLKNDYNRLLYHSNDPPTSQNYPPIKVCIPPSKLCKTPKSLTKKYILGNFLYRVSKCKSYTHLSRRWVSWYSLVLLGVYHDTYLSNRWVYTKLYLPKDIKLFYPSQMRKSWVSYSCKCGFKIKLINL